jgi:hypothetical protein
MCRSWPPPKFRNSKFFLGGVVNPTPNSQPGGPGTTFRLALVVLPGAYALASVAGTVTQHPHD